MKPALTGLFLFALVSILTLGKARAKDIFPYPTHTRTLANGLEIVMVPFDSPGIIAYYTIVRTGSRNEIEKGKSGFAHFFEHMMFRGTEKYSSESYNELFKELGSDANAFTTDDYTCYHALFGSDGLEKVIEAEADRFMNLKYTISDFQQESKAVLGEYYKNYSNPFSKIYEKVRDTAYSAHTYKHTTMGFLKDIENMPNQYDYSIEFYDRWYRPGNVVILIVGDINVEESFELVSKYYGKWKPRIYSPDFPVEPEQNRFKTAHIDWENETLPYMAIAYHMPAFDASNKENAGLDILAQLIFGSNSPLYQKLIIEDQSAEYLSSYVPDHRDPFLYIVFSRIKNDAKIDEVRKSIFQAVEKAQNELVDTAKLESIKSHIKYSFAMNLDTASSVAGSLAHFIQLTGDPASINELYRRYEEITPKDLQKLAQKYLRKSNCTEITLTGVKN